MLCLNLWHIFVKSLFGESYKKLGVLCHIGQRKKVAKAVHREFENRA